MCMCVNSAGGVFLFPAHIYTCTYYGDDIESVICMLGPTLNAFLAHSTGKICHTDVLYDRTECLCPNMYNVVADLRFLALTVCPIV